MLKPLGILALITPYSFLADDFSDKAMIHEMEARFSFLGQDYPAGGCLCRLWGRQLSHQATVLAEEKRTEGLDGPAAIPPAPYMPLRTILIRSMRQSAYMSRC